MERYIRARKMTVSAIFLLFIFLITGAYAASGTGTLTITSVPPGASVYLDGTLLGTTPFTSGQIPAGDHSIILKLAGYEDFPATTTVPPDGSVQGTYTLVPAVTVTGTTTSPSTGELRITSDPPGATVSLDGTVRGITPLTLPAVPAGEHSVLLTMTGYADFPSTITVPAGGTFKDAYTLSCNILSVSSSPSGATVTLDGTGRGTTPVSLRALTTGAHTLVLTLDGYDPYTTTVTVLTGTEIKAAYSLAAASTPTADITTAKTATPVQTTFIPVHKDTQTPVTTMTTAAPPVNCTQYYSETALFETSPEGKLNCTAVIHSKDLITTLTIPAGTKIIMPPLQSGTNISVVSLLQGEIPSASATGGLTSTGYASRFLPDQTTFDRPATVAFRLDKDAWDRFSGKNLTIAGTSGSGWEQLPTTLDPAVMTASAPVQHFSTIGLFTKAPPAVPAPAAPSVKDTIRSVVAPATATLPLSPYIPPAAMPVAAVMVGIAISVAGTVAAGSSFVSRYWENLLKLLRGFVTSETIGMVNVTEVQKRRITPARNLAGVFFCMSAREILVIVLSLLGFAAAFLLQARLSFAVSTLVIFLCAGGIATILHDLAHKVQAYRTGCLTEYQFWTLGTATMFITAWLFGSAFAKPSRTIITSEKSPTPRENAAIKLAGPLASVGVAVVSLVLLPLGGLFTVAGAAGFSMNLLNSVFSLVPVKPNDGVEVYAWNKAVWALVFFPLLVVYLWLYL